MNNLPISPEIKDITIQNVITKFDRRIEPQNNTIFKRCFFQIRSQMPDETLTKLISKKCSFETITPDQILRDRIISGLADNDLRKKLLAKTDLT